MSAGLLLRFALPLFIGNLLQQFYNIADTLIVGQALGAGVLIAAAWLRARVKNGGIWGVAELASCAVAVTCLLFMCILTVLRGPLFLGQEGEDSDELS